MTKKRKYILISAAALPICICLLYYMLAAFFFSVSDKAVSVDVKVYRKGETAEDSCYDDFTVRDADFARTVNRYLDKTLISMNPLNSRIIDREDAPQWDDEFCLIFDYGDEKQLISIRGTDTSIFNRDGTYCLRCKKADNSELRKYLYSICGYPYIPLN